MTITVDKKEWERLKKNFLKAERASIDVGWMESDRYGPENDNLPMAQVAKWNEEGHNNGQGSLVTGSETPPRPFMRVGFKNALLSGQNDKNFRMIVDAVAEGKNIFQPMRIAGPAFRQTLQEVMMRWDDPRNSDFTIDQKGFNDPLYHTGQLIAGVSFMVKQGGSEV